MRLIPVIFPGHGGAIHTVFDEASGLLRESACESSGSGLCLRVFGTRIELMSAGLDKRDIGPIHSKRSPKIDPSFFLVQP